MTRAARYLYNLNTSLRCAAAHQGYRAYPDGYGAARRGALVPRRPARGVSPILPDVPARRTSSPTVPGVIGAGFLPVRLDPRVAPAARGLFVR